MCVYVCVCERAREIIELSRVGARPRVAALFHCITVSGAHWFARTRENVETAVALQIQVIIAGAESQLLIPCTLSLGTNLIHGVIQYFTRLILLNAHMFRFIHSFILFAPRKDIQFTNPECKTGAGVGQYCLRDTNNCP